MMKALVLIALVAAGQSRPQGESSKRTALDLTRFHAAVREVVMRHYPQATTLVHGDTIHFEHDTQLFLVELPDKAGERTDARPERGPKDGGVHGDIRVGPGQNPTARAPGANDGRYYVEHLYAPYSSQHDRHLHVVIRLPRRRDPVAAAFLPELEKVIARFGEFLESPGSRASSATCTVLLRNPGQEKISLIKAVREVTGLGLAAAKDLVEASAANPTKVLEGLTPAKADVVRKRLELAGGQVEIR